MFASTLTTLKSRAGQLLRGQEDGGVRQEDDFDEFSQLPNINTFTGFGNVLDANILVRYSIQNGRNSDKAPSAFLLPCAKGQVTVGLIKANFPLAGRFHFRFKAPDPDPAACRVLWLDLDGVQDAVPVFQSEVHMKALQIPDRAGSRQVEFGQLVLTCYGAPELYRPPSRVGRARAEVDHGGFDDGFAREVDVVGGERDTGYTSAPSRPGRKTTGQSQALRRSQTAPPDFDDVEFSPDNPPPAAAPPAPAPASMFDLVDFGEPQAAPSTPSSTPAPAPRPQPKVFDRAQLVAERERGVHQAVVQAQQNFQAAQQAEAQLRKDKQSVANSLAADLDKWAKTSDGETWKDIRGLLSTVHEVTWPNSEWKQVTMSELIAPNAVKKQYRKGILMYHPDKVKDAPPDVQYRAERIFQALNESFKSFQQ